MGLPKILIIILLPIFFFNIIFSSVKAELIPNNETTESLANNEFAYIRAIYNKYIYGNNLTTLSTLYDPASRYGDNINYYRALCTMASITTIVEGTANVNTPIFTSYFLNRYDSRVLRDIFDRKDIIDNDIISNHVMGATIYDCILATSLSKKYIPLTIKNNMIKDYVYITKGIHKNIVDAGGSIRYFNDKSGNYGDSQAEEAMIIASMLYISSELLPAVSSTSEYGLTPSEKSNFKIMAENIAVWAYSVCDRKINNCSLTYPDYLVVNHQMDPSPIYTLSMISGYSEIAMLSNQFKSHLPINIFNNQTKLAINAVKNSVLNYIDLANFNLKGTFNTVSSRGAVTSTSKYGNMSYNADSNSDYPVNSSFPINLIDGWHQYTDNSSKIYSYTFKGSYFWTYICAEGYCKAGTRLKTDSYLRGLGNWNTTVPIPTSVKAVSMWLIPNSDTLKSYLITDNHIWHYTCTSSTSNPLCIPNYVKSISEAFPPFSNLPDIWQTYKPPVSYLNAFSQYIIPGTNTLNTFIFKKIESGNRVWSYRCENIGTPNTICTWVDNVTLQSYINSINPVNWPVRLDITKELDDVFHYYLNGELRGYLVQGDKVWVYKCTANVCTSYYVRKINEIIGGYRESPYGVINQYRFGSKTDGRQSINYNGVGEWGFNATLQNSAFSALYIIDNSNLSLYQDLQTTQNLKRKENPYFPTTFNGVTYSFGLFNGTKQTKLLSYLTNGWRQLHYDTGEQLPLYGDGLFFTPPTNDMRVNTHWWMNILSAKNHSIAYLTLTKRKIIAPILSASTPDTINENSINIVDITDQKSNFLIEYFKNKFVGVLSTLDSLLYRLLNN